MVAALIVVVLKIDLGLKTDLETTFLGLSLF